MGMIGTALADVSPSAEVAADCADFTNDPSCIRGWTDSTPMTRVAGFDARWTLDVKLQDGHLKFRTRNSWEENWGGGGFPKGPAVWYGENIRVAAGHYRVTTILKRRPTSSSDYPDPEPRSSAVRTSPHPLASARH